MQSELHPNNLCSLCWKLANQSVAWWMVGRRCDIDCVKHTICMGGFQDGEMGI